ncbi:MAG: nucleotidyltransferase [Oscillospiraceae bacterium]|nr:nucleotidyltransferase [Oscillospiraceae bacterium]
MSDRKTALVIMAAGIGSRYGAGIKQLEKVGLSGEIIMDFSVHDAIKAGFNKIIFIIREDIEKEFREIIGGRVDKLCSSLGVETAYCFQRPDDLPEGVLLPPERKKPWGTGQAVLSCAEEIDCPFAVINADDYYGRQAFTLLHDFLISDDGDTAYCMAGFVLGNTLSDNGAVTRGICLVDDRGYLTGVDETKGIVKTALGAEAGGRVLNVDSTVSMNMWGLKESYIPLLKEGFEDFFRTMKKEDELKSEYLLPIHIDSLLKEGKCSVKVLVTEDSWFGITYAEDKDEVKKAFSGLIASGVYGKDLFEDLS